MRREIFNDVRAIAEEVHANEDQCDIALAGLTRLTANILETRVKHGLPAATAREALQRALEVVNHSARAREAMLDLHSDLAQLNFRELGIGDIAPCPRVRGADLHVVQERSGNAA